MKLLSAAGIAWCLSTLGQPLSDSFEVVSIRPTKKGDLYHLKRECANDRFVASGMPLSFLVEWSFKIPESRIVGLPPWSTDWENAYDFEAKSSTAIDDDRCRLMVQHLLEDRFGMAWHLETRKIRVYFLTVSSRKLKLKVANSGGAAEGVRINGARAQAVGERDAPAGFSMARLANWLSGNPAVDGLPVIDRTGLTGSYSFDLTYSTREGDERPSIFTAVQEQLGLRLKPGRAPTEVLAVDRIERPSGND